MLPSLFKPYIDFAPWRKDRICNICAQFDLFARIHCGIHVVLLELCARISRRRKLLRIIMKAFRARCVLASCRPCGQYHRPCGSSSPMHFQDYLGIVVTAPFVCRHIDPPGDI